MTDSNTLDTTKDAASDLAHQTSSHVRDVVGTTGAEARSVMHDARDQASEVMNTARSELRSQAVTQAESLSKTLGDFGAQLMDMARGNADAGSQVSQLAQSAGQTLADRARRLDEQGIDGVVSDVKRFARNRPGAFVFGSVALGFAIGRLAKHADLGEVAQHAKAELSNDTEPQSLQSPAQSPASLASPMPAGAQRPAGGSATATPTPSTLAGNHATAGEAVRP